MRSCQAADRSRGARSTGSWPQIRPRRAPPRCGVEHLRPRRSARSTTRRSGCRCRRRPRQVPGRTGTARSRARPPPTARGRPPDSHLASAAQFSAVGREVRGHAAVGGACSGAVRRRSAVTGLLACAWLEQRPRDDLAVDVAYRVGLAPQPGLGPARRTRVCPCRGSGRLVRTVLNGDRDLLDDALARDARRPSWCRRRAGTPSAAGETMSCGRRATFASRARRSTVAAVVRVRDALAVDEDGDPVRHAHGDVEPRQRDAAGARHRDVGVGRRASAELAERLVDVWRRGPHRAGRAVDGQTSWRPRRTDDVAAGRDRSVSAPGRRCRARRRASVLVLEHVADGARVGVDGPLLAVDAEHDGLLQADEHGRRRPRARSRGRPEPPR